MLLIGSSGIKKLRHLFKGTLYNKWKCTKKHAVPLVTPIQILIIKSFVNIPSQIGIERFRKKKIVSSEKRLGVVCVGIPLVDKVFFVLKISKYFQNFFHFHPSKCLSVPRCLNRRKSSRSCLNVRWPTHKTSFFANMRYLWINN